MRKFYFCTFLSVFITAFTIAQNVETLATTPVSHWSIGIKSGINYFNAFPTPQRELDRMHWINGGIVEYSINPLAGIGVELLNNPYGGKINARQTLHATIVDVLPYFSVNISNLLFPNRDGFWKRTNFFSEIGFGYGFYHYSMNKDSAKYYKSMLTKFGINAEYNLNKKITFCIDGQYRYYDEGAIGGSYLAKGNCEAFTATIGLRYKFCTKSKKHVRNMSVLEYAPQPKPLIVVDTMAEELYQNTLKRLKIAEDQQNEIQKKVLILEEEINILSKEKEAK